MRTAKNAQVIANAKATTEQAYFNTKEVAALLNITDKGLATYISLHKELRPQHMGKGSRTNLWTVDEVCRLLEFRANSKFKSCSYTSVTAEDIRLASANHTTSSNTNTETTSTSIAIPETNKSTAVSTNTATPEALISMFDAFLEIEQEEQKSENRAANRKFRYLFENMTETDMQEFFKPLTERFKFSYVTKVIEDIQSQTLTCIKNGKLKGLDKYKLTYTAFLHLCKFAAENNCPLNIPQAQLQNG